MTALLYVARATFHVNFFDLRYESVTCNTNYVVRMKDVHIASRDYSIKVII